MNSTPRLRSAFPSTPQTNPRFRSLDHESRNQYPSPQSDLSTPPSLATFKPVAPVSNAKSPEKPALIPLDIVDGPSQRLYVTAFYVALAAWRLYDWWQVSDDLDSTWLFLKWLGIDAVFLVSLPAFRIPWLEWSFGTTLSIWLLHVVANAFLMYRIPIPIGAWIGGLARLVYVRELSISEHRVNPGDIIHKSSIILGKQIIQILPEGSAMLNPDRRAFCLNGTVGSVDLPIFINQTSPKLIELLRFDLDTYENETIIINAKQARQLKRQADKGHHKAETNTPRLLRYPVSKTGMYQLQRVVDESDLEVRQYNTDTAVVACPQAEISATQVNRCMGDLSDVSLTVHGVPPFKVTYSKRINRQRSSSIVQSIQPEDVEPPFSPDETSGILVDPKRPNLEWTRSRSVSVEVSEALNVDGSWAYEVQEVEDGFGNKVVYDPDTMGRKNAEGKGQHTSLAVHRRPKIDLISCNAETFLRVAKEDSTYLPVRVVPGEHLSPADWPLKLRYSFVPEVDGGIPAVEVHAHDMVNERSLPRISKAGTYNVESIASQFCPGEVREPSSCLLYNPPQPDLTLDSEDIFDKCAGNTIGLIVNLGFTGTPPFKVQYTVTHQGSAHLHQQTFHSLRGQIELKESSAGLFKYQFLSVEDEVYGPVSLKGKTPVLQQDIKPPASATFTRKDTIKACLGQTVELDVRLSGESPWELEYEHVHGSRRTKHVVVSDQDVVSIQVPELFDGGKHSIVLNSVQDKTKCRTSIRDERTIDVWTEQPRAAFGDKDGRRSILALEDKSVQLPLKLKGTPPWTVRVSHDDQLVDYTFRDPNAQISVEHAGKYEIVSVHDNCPGVVDATANTFEVAWIDRPTMAFKDPTLTIEGENKYRKPAVCEGEDASLTLSFTGHPPYQLKYQQRSDPLKGSASVSDKPLSAAMGNTVINLDTSRAGENTYTFSQLSDGRYGHEKKHARHLILRQQVHPLPSARFGSPGKTYGHCKGDAVGTDTIPIVLEGAPPFALEISITHHGSTKPEIVRVKDVMSNNFDWALSRKGLDLGTHVVHLRSIKDGRGCEKTIDPDHATVRIMVSDPPTIIPLEAQTDYCVGERVSYSLAGQPPFDVFYSFRGHERKASSTSTTFRRIAEQEGEFTITGISDSASGKCKALKNITKIIHPMPSVKISKGKTSTVDIHEGGEVDILFEFTGTPPFEFTYTRSENAKKGKKGAVLETRNEWSEEFSKTVKASDEGTYEVVAIKDRYCAFSVQKDAGSAGKAQKLLQR